MKQEDFDAMIASAVRTPVPDDTLRQVHRDHPDIPSVIVDPFPSTFPRPDPLPIIHPEERVTLASDSWMKKRVRKIEVSNQHILTAFLIGVIALLLGSLIVVLFKR